MKILVIDDTQENLQIAKQVLEGHELTVASTYDEAYKLLKQPEASYEAVEAELVRRGFTKNPYDKGTTEEERKAHWEARERIAVELCPPPPFEAVLSDLLMPAGREQQGLTGAKYIGQEMPVGFALALMAVLQGARYVAVVTNMNHHDHPAAAMLDRLTSGSFCDDDQHPAKITVNEVPVDFVNDAPMVGIEGTTCSDCSGSGKQTERACWLCRGSGKNERDGSDCHLCKGSGSGTPTCYTCAGSGKVLGKDWGKVLARLLGQG